MGTQTTIASALRTAVRRRGLVADARGNTAIEMAFVLPPLLLFLFAIIATGQAMWLQNALDVSVADAARCASVNPTLCGTQTQITTYAANRAGAGFDSSIFSVATASCGNQVSASYPLALAVPFTSFSVNLSALACYPS
jgi:Flp pilus assembly protein TadG